MARCTIRRNKIGSDNNRAVIPASTWITRASREKDPREDLFASHACKTFADAEGWSDGAPEASPEKYGRDVERLSA